MQIIDFPFIYVGDSQLGEIYRPYAIIKVYSKLYQDWFPVETVVDTGADYTVFPKRYAKIFGIDLKKETNEEKTSGIGGNEKIFLIKNIPIKIGKIKLNIPAGFLDRNNIPALLGRLNCLENLELCFKNKRTIFKK